jgi:hypothetical protein
MDRRELNRIIDHVAAAIDAAPEGKDPFFHLRLANIFPPDVYARMMRKMPVASDYGICPDAPSRHAPWTAAARA